MKTFTHFKKGLIITSSRTYYYARVSTTEQNLDRQLEVFKSLGADERDIITDKQSGKNLDRDGYNALKNALLRPNDTLVIKVLTAFQGTKWMSKMSFSVSGITTSA